MEIDVIFRGMEGAFCIFQWERFGCKHISYVPTSDTPQPVLDKLGRLPPGTRATVRPDKILIGSEMEIRVTQITAGNTTRMELTEVGERGVVLGETFYRFRDHTWLKGQFTSEQIGHWVDVAFIPSKEQGKPPVLFDVGDAIPPDDTEHAVEDDEVEGEESDAAAAAASADVSRPAAPPPPPPPRPGNGGTAAKAELNGSAPPPPSRTAALPSSTGRTAASGSASGLSRAPSPPPTPPRPAAAGEATVGTGQGNPPGPPPLPSTRLTPPKGVPVVTPPAPLRPVAAGEATAGTGQGNPPGPPPLPGALDTDPFPGISTLATGAEPPAAPASAKGNEEDDRLEEWLQTGGKIPLPPVQ